jgi:hypothetical protein
MPIVLALFMLAMLALHASGELGVQEAGREQARVDAAATSFLAYREAVLDHLNTTPGFTGTAADAVLAFPWGYLRDARWTHVVDAHGTLYVHATAGNSAPLLLPQLQQKTRNGFLLGRQSGGQLVAASGGSTGITVPASVPEGAVVMVGR